MYVCACRHLKFLSPSSNRCPLFNSFLTWTCTTYKKPIKLYTKFLDSWTCSMNNENEHFFSLHNDPLNHFFLITNPCFNIMHISLVQSRLNTLNTAFPPQRLLCSSLTPARPLPPTSASGRKWTRLHHLASCSHSHSGQREGKCQGRHSHPENAHFSVLREKRS